MPKRDDEAQEPTVFDRVVWYVIYLVAFVLMPAFAAFTAFNGTRSLRDAAATYAGTALICGLILLIFWGAGRLEEIRDARAARKKGEFEALADDAKEAVRHKRKLLVAIALSALASLYIGFAWSERDADNALEFYLILAGAAFFAPVALMAWAAFFRRWSEGEESAIYASLGSMVLAVIVVAAALGTIAVGLFYGASWLSSIPSWAAVIVVLLILILFKPTK